MVQPTKKQIEAAKKKRALNGQFMPKQSQTEERNKSPSGTVPSPSIVSDAAQNSSVERPRPQSAMVSECSIL